MHLSCRIFLTSSRLKAFAATLFILVPAGSSNLHGQIPGGSYQQSCKDIRVSGSTLLAACKARNGAFRNSQLTDFRQCISQIENLNGQLHCSKGAAPPAGSYSQSCRDIFMTGSTLHASCKNRAGQFVAATVADVRVCRSQIENFDGRLSCSTGSSPPPGSYTSSCRDISRTGNSLTANCRNRAGAFVSSRLDNVNQCVGTIENFDGRLGCSTGAPPPAGSYTGSCRDIVRNGNTLHASCKNRANQFVATSLNNINQCVGTIENFEGRLGCSTGAAPPGGSYTGTCRDIFRTGNTLHASCKNRAGQFVATSLNDINQCVGTIENFEGQLGCSTGGAPPPGSYTSSCRDIFRGGNTLHASCKNRAGQFVAAKLDNFNQCVGNIENFDGQLGCSTGGAPPPGFYTQSCRDIFRTGNTLHASCKKQDGQFVGTSLDHFDQCVGGIVNFNGTLRCGNPQYSYVPPSHKRALPPSRECPNAPQPDGLYRKEWMRLGGPNGPMGCPISSVQKHSDGGAGGEVNFQNGVVSTSPDVWPNGVMGVYQDWTTIVVDWDVTWDDQQGFNYDKFLVRWDIDSKHNEDDQVDVIEEMTADQLVLMKYKQDTHLRTRGNFVIDASKTTNISNYTILLEGCDMASKIDPFSKSTCRQGWMHPPHVRYVPLDKNPSFFNNVVFVDLSAIPPTKSVADSKAAYDDRAAAAILYNACTLLPQSAYRHEENYGLFIWAKLAYADYFQVDHCPGRDVNNRDEAVRSLMRQHVESKSGTTHDSKPFRTGEYDTFMISLLPVVYKYGHVLPPATIDHIVDELLNKRGPLDTGDFTVIGIAPESENHIMNIESARYLTNQWLFSRTADPQYDNSKNGMDDWMLHHLREFLLTDFIEYNAHPYQDYSLTALFNLYSFTSAQNSSSRRVKLAAEMVLDYVMAKAAVSTNDSRRVAPFRRRADHVLDKDNPDMLSLRADPITPFTMGFAGTTDILSEIQFPNLAPNNFAFEMQYAGVDDYRIPDPILDLMIDRTHRNYFQRFHHYADEAYAGSPSYLLSAGGHYATFAYTIAGTGDHDDIGMALPTNLLPDGRFHLLNDLIRFEGVEDDTKRSNMCVTRDFACGLHPQLPDRYGASCTATQGHFTFVNQSGGCKAGRPGSGYYVAMYRDQDFGFLETYDTSLNSAVTFEQFQAGVMQKNGRSQFNRMGQNTYVKSNGERVVFELAPDSKVIGPAEAPFFASGTIVNSALNSALVTIDNPTLRQQIVLDFKDALNPRCTGCTTH